MRKLLDATARRAAEREATAIAALELAQRAAREEQQADSLWVSEHGKSFALGFVSCLMLLILAALIYFKVSR